MKKLTLFVSSILLSLSSMAQTDVTYRLTNPDFEKGDEGWTNTNMSVQSNSSFEQKSGNNYMEKWVGSSSQAGTASLVQGISTKMPKGLYRLTVAAQNIKQGSSEAQSGVTIWGNSKTNKTVVTSAGDYSVDFELKMSAGTTYATTTSLKVAFEAANATGNWICCDNFRLQYLSVDTAIVNTIIRQATAQLEKKLDDAHKVALTAVIEKTTKAVADGQKDLTGITMELVDTWIEAEANTKAYSTLSSLVRTVNSSGLIDKEGNITKKMSNASADALLKAMADAQAATTDNDPVALTEALQTAYDNATVSASSYSKFLSAIERAEASYNESMIGAEEFLKSVNSMKEIYEKGDATDSEITAYIAEINENILLFRLANGEKGDGKEIQVTYTNPYVLTGATEAIMRANFTGDNIIEKGVCWSTEHNPTVTDSRTTKNFTLNGTMIHVKGLESATVYYFRPYIINKTYWVAYGDEVKVVTHPKGTCSGSWDEGAPTAEANNRCRTAIDQTIEYFNQWTGVMGFHLSGHYGANTPTADCSYGGWMRIGPNTGNQAIGTVIHETGHGVGVGTRKIALGYSTGCYDDANVHNWKWYGREANRIYSFLENKEADPYNSDFCMVGDGTHAWGASASYDWFVNGADKDKHTELQYLGGCALLYGMFIDGLCPTDAYPNGLAGYTYNFDDNTKYYLMSKDADRGLNSGLIYQRGASNVSWKPLLEQGAELTDSAAWQIEYNAAKGYYSFRNVATGNYLSHSGSSYASLKTSATATEQYQLMPDRTNILIGKDSDYKTHGYWLTWNNSGNKALGANGISTTNGYGAISNTSFTYTDAATKQQWIILSEHEIRSLYGVEISTGVQGVIASGNTGSAPVQSGIYNISGQRIPTLQPGINIIRYNDGTSKKIIK